ncbi:MAG: glycine-rich domain-containing protein, partial [Gammaproteobacteria bacterium]
MKSTTAYDAIEALNLDRIKMKLMHSSGEGWSKEHADAVEVEYRRFLYLIKLYPNEQTTPTVEVDTFWHYHILDTMKYAQDCEATFGFFVHHQQYLGMEGTDEDTAEHGDAIDRMRELYEETFGLPYPGTARSTVAGQDVAGEVMLDAQGAFCSRTPPKVDAAFCSRTPPKVDAAFCSRTPPKVDAAFCSRTPPKVDAAFCSRT